MKYLLLMMIIFGCTSVPHNNSPNTPETPNRKYKFEIGDCFSVTHKKGDNPKYYTVLVSRHLKNNYEVFYIEKRKQFDTLIIKIVSIDIIEKFSNSNCTNELLVALDEFGN